MVFAASKANMSLSCVAPFVIKHSSAWVNASIPVLAVMPFGIVSISEASTIATLGMSCGSTQTIFLPRVVSVIT